MTVEEKVKLYFKSIIKYDDNEIDLNANIFTDYSIDSVQAVKLISDIEVEYDIDIPDEDAQKICSLNDVVSLIKGLTSLE